MTALSIMRRRCRGFESIPIQAQKIGPARQSLVVGIQKGDAESTLDVVVNLPCLRRRAFFRYLHGLLSNHRVFGAGGGTSFFARAICERLHLGALSGHEYRI